MSHKLLSKPVHCSWKMSPCLRALLAERNLNYSRREKAYIRKKNIVEEFKHLEQYTYIFYVRNGVFGRSLQRAPENPLDDQIPMEEGCDGGGIQVQHLICIRCHPIEGQNLWDRIPPWGHLPTDIGDPPWGHARTFPGALCTGTFDSTLPPEWEATSHSAGSLSLGLITGQMLSRAFRR